MTLTQQTFGMLDHLREIARALFHVDAIDIRIESLKKEVADLEAHCERLL